LDGDTRLHDVVDHALVLSKRERKYIAQNRHIRLAHKGSHSLANFHHPDLGKRTQGLAPDRPADIQPFGALTLAHKQVAWAHAAAEELFTQKVKDFLEALLGLVSGANDGGDACGHACGYTSGHIPVLWGFTRQDAIWECEIAERMSGDDTRLSAWGGAAW